MLGDRYEAHIQFLCSKKIPLIHFHGGEATYGAIDENLTCNNKALRSILHQLKFTKKLIEWGES